MPDKDPFVYIVCREGGRVNWCSVAMKRSGAQALIKRGFDHCQFGTHTVEDAVPAGYDHRSPMEET